MAGLLQASIDGSGARSGAQTIVSAANQAKQALRSLSETIDALDARLAKSGAASAKTSQGLAKSAASSRAAAVQLRAASTSVGAISLNSGQASAGATALAKSQDLIAASAKRGFAALQQMATAIKNIGTAAVTASAQLNRFSASQNNVAENSQRVAATLAKQRAEVSRLSRAEREADAQRQRTPRAAVPRRGGSFGGGAAATGFILGAGGPLLGAVGAGAAVAGALTQVAKLEQSLLDLQAVTGVSEDRLKSFEVQARNLGATTLFTARQIADAQLELARAGLGYNDIIQGLEGVLKTSTATGISLAETADILTNIRSAFKLSASELEDVGSVIVATGNRANATSADIARSLQTIGSISGNLGVSLRETAASFAVLSQGGPQLRGNQGARQLRQAISELLRAQGDENSQSRRAIEALGLTIDDVNIELHGTVGAFEAFKKAGLDAATAVRIFGTESVNAALALSEHSGLARQYLRELVDSQDELDRQVAARQNSVIGRLRALGSAFGELSLAISDKLNVKSGSKATLDFLTNLVRIIAGAPAAAREFTGALGGLQNVILSLGKAVSVTSEYLVGGLKLLTGPGFQALGISIDAVGEATELFGDRFERGTQSLRNKENFAEARKEVQSLAKAFREDATVALESFENVLTRRGGNFQGTRILEQLFGTPESINNSVQRISDALTRVEGLRTSVPNIIDVSGIRETIRSGLEEGISVEGLKEKLNASLLQALKDFGGNVGGNVADDIAKSVAESAAKLAGPLERVNAAIEKGVRKSLREAAVPENVIDSFVRFGIEDNAGNEEANAVALSFLKDQSQSARRIGENVLKGKVGIQALSEAAAELAGTVKKSVEVVDTELDKLFDERRTTAGESAAELIRQLELERDIIGEVNHVKRSTLEIDSITQGNDRLLSKATQDQIRALTKQIALLSELEATGHDVGRSIGDALGRIAFEGVRGSEAIDQLKAALVRLAFEKAIVDQLSQAFASLFSFIGRGVFGGTTTGTGGTHTPGVGGTTGGNPLVDVPGGGGIRTLQSGGGPNTFIVTDQDDLGRSVRQLQGDRKSVYLRRRRT